ncbi:hypothetical protein IKD57_02345 [Candidatus Saccharibacteria bacterium]|nr:hypothetical protein [Candidatus Saccharibacteria bacterium]
MADKKPVENGSTDTEVGVVSRKEYEKLKRRAIRFEPTNFGFILVIPCEGEHDWCEMSDYSALYYKYYVCEQLGVPVRMTDDLDSFYTQYEIGRVRVKGYNSVRKRLEKLGMLKAEETRDRCVIFQLNKKFTKTEREGFLEEEKEKQANANRIVRVEFSDPALYQKMVEAATRLHRVCMRRMDKLASITNGKRMVELADDMIRGYYDMSAMDQNDKEKIMAGWHKLQKQATQLLVEMQIVASLKLWTRENCIEIAENIIDIKNRIEGHIKRESDRFKERD